jgi:rsbT co-antagonist protein RsbR
VEHVKANNATVTQESTIEFPEGERFYQTSMFPISDNSGRIVAIGAVATDITERKQVLEEQRRLVALIENSTDFIGISSLEGHAQYVNQAGRAMMGLDGLEAVHQTHVPEYYVPEDRVWIERDVLPQVFSTGIWSGEVRFKNFATGDLIPVHHTLFLMRDQDSDEPMAVGTISRDISEQKRQAAELDAQRRLLQGILDNAPFGVFVLDETGQYTVCNKEAAGNLALSPEQVLGKTDDDILPAEIAAANWDRCQHILATGERVSHELDFSSRPGHLESFAHSWFPIADAAGRNYAVCGIITNITERKQQEAERETMQQQIIDAQRNALRELSTPLIPITDEVVIMPLIGTIDSQRAQQVMEALLEGVAQHQADLVILDITGVSVVDTQVAQAFIQAAQAVRLLGAQVMLTGIQPQIAQTLVHLGVDLGGIQTQGSLQAGIAAALTKRQHE